MMFRVDPAIAHFQAGWRSIAGAPVAALGGVGFYAIILFVFARIWEMVLSQRFDMGMTPEEAVWYLAATEWILLSIPRNHQDIPEDIADGTLAHELLQPVPYLTAKLCQMTGALAANLLFMGMAGLVLAFLLTGYTPSLSRLLALAVLGPLGAFLGILLYSIVGLGGYWFGRGIGPYITVQKMVFVLGGLLLPLFIYPAWLQTIALGSPFSAMLFRPASVVFESYGPDLFSTVLSELAAIGFWMVVMATILMALYRRVVTGLIS